MPDPEYAVVQIDLDQARLGELRSIPNLKVTDRPEWITYPTALRVSALADAGAQDAARALGFTVTVVLSPEVYQAHIDDVFRARSDEPSPPDKPA